MEEKNPLTFENLTLAFSRSFLGRVSIRERGVIYVLILTRLSSAQPLMAGRYTETFHIFTQYERTIWTVRSISRSSLFWVDRLKH